VGLGCNVVSTVLEGGPANPLRALAFAPLTLTLVGGLISIAALVFLLDQRLPGRSVESLVSAIVATAALSFPLLALVVVPALGWHPGRELSAMVAPFLDLVTLCLAGSLLSLTERHPVAYRYLIAGLACLFFSHGLTSVLFLAGRQSSPIPLSAVVLWGACLWSWAIVHRSQREPLEPVPFRSSRLGWAHSGLMLVAALVAPAVLGSAAVLHIRTSVSLLVAGSAVLPVLVVIYSLYQLFARSATEYRAQHDPLTGVCNQVLFNDRLEAALVDARRTGRSVAVLFLDLDRFKSINDSLGHEVGNEVLKAVVKRLQGRLRPWDTLARMGGDEFTILFRHVAGKERSSQLGERILKAFSEPFNVGGKQLRVQTSIGIAVAPDDGEDVKTLFKNADTAMYQAKAVGRNTYVVYDSTMGARAELRFALETSLRSAVERGGLTVHYQPKISTMDGRIVGCEALARWHHPRLGFISPGVFIPLAEETSLIATLGEWVLETACLQARSWHERGLSCSSVSVNVSARQFARQSVVRMVADVLERTGLDPRLLELEVTESVLVEHLQDTAASLAELRAMGVRCSIDDFGTGYSALTYLTEMQVDSIKIDPSFVRRIDSGSDSAPIVGAVIALAHSLQLTVVAEGVETEAQYEFLSAHGCDQVQGYLFSAAVPPQELEDLLSNQDQLRAAARATSGPPATPRPAGASSPVLPQTRLAAVLASAGPAAGQQGRLEKGDLLTVLAALQPDNELNLTGPRALRLLSARMAVGTLAGLATVTGGLTAAGALPVAAQQVAAQVLQRTTGIRVPSDLPRTGGTRTGTPAATGLSGSTTEQASLEGVTDFGGAFSDAGSSRVLPPHPGQ
jgi:diguanylate cyclase (GGDEF)-like protein